MFRIGQMFHNDKHMVKLECPTGWAEFVVGNPEDIPNDLKFSVYTGDRREGLFEFDPQDQFAYFINLEKVKITIEEE